MHRVVDGTCIVVKNASEFLAVFGLCGSKLASCDWLGILLFLSVDWCSIGMRGVLGPLGMWMLKSCKSFGDIFGHGEINMFVRVVPIEVDTAEYFAFFVDGGIVMFL